MSTRCRIGIKNEDGTITSIYCHHDGYLSYVGKKLNDFYDNEKSIRQLLDLDDISSLGNNPVADPNGWDMKAPFSDEMCVAYSTRGEYCPARVDQTEDEFREDSEEYGYLFKAGAWWVSDHGRIFKKVVDLI